MRDVPFRQRIRVAQPRLLTVGEFSVGQQRRAQRRLKCGPVDPDADEHDLLAGLDLG